MDIFLKRKKIVSNTFLQTTADYRRLEMNVIVPLQLANLGFVTLLQFD